MILSGTDFCFSVAFVLHAWGRAMGRKIVLLSDGTGNSAAKVWRTNVWRVFESLDLSGSEQVAFYDDGVGTSSFKPLAILGGAFGYGLKRNVIDIPRSRHNPKILGVDDAEIVGDRITELRPIPRNFFTQETERRIGELGASCVALVVRDMLVHHAP